MWQTEAIAAYQISEEAKQEELKADQLKRNEMSRIRIFEILETILPPAEFERLKAAPINEKHPDCIQDGAFEFGVHPNNVRCLRLTLLTPLTSSGRIICPNLIESLEDIGRAMTAIEEELDWLKEAARFQAAQEARANGPAPELPEPLQKALGYMMQTVSDMEDQRCSPGQHVLVALAGWLEKIDTTLDSVSEYLNA